MTLFTTRQKGETPGKILLPHFEREVLKGKETLAIISLFLIWLSTQTRNLTNYTTTTTTTSGLVSTYQYLSLQIGWYTYRIKERIWSVGRPNPTPGLLTLSGGWG